MADLTTRLGTLTLPNPVMTASGCAANGRELHRFFDVSELGAFVTKTVMADPRSGRPTPRMAETPSGMLNSIGLQGPGIGAFLDKDLTWLKSVGARVLVSIAGNTAVEFAQVARDLVAHPAFDAVVGVEVNISCPNVATMINPLLGIAIDTDRMRPQLAAVTGGLSGPAVRPVAVRAIWQCTAAMRENRIDAVPIIGVGGVRSGLDALELLAAGASAVQVGTATFNDPSAPRRVLTELESALDERGFASLTDVVGLAHDRKVTL